MGHTCGPSMWALRQKINQSNVQNELMIGKTKSATVHMENVLHSEIVIGEKTIDFRHIFSKVVI